MVINLPQVLPFLMRIYIIPARNVIPKFYLVNYLAKFSGLKNFLSSSTEA